MVQSEKFCQRIEDDFTQICIRILYYFKRNGPLASELNRQNKEDWFTHFDLRCLTVVEKSARNKCQSKNSTPATPCLYKHNREHEFYCNWGSGGHTDVATSWYLY
jgi:hypothetical protein